jgi:HJR/Mrr/RecB family endonuclease
MRSNLNAFVAIMARLSFTGFRFELTGIAQSLTTGFNWDNKCKVAWTGSNRIAEKFKQYADGSATQRLQEESARRQRDIQEWPIRHKEWLGRFLEITDRKVSVLDDYGDENWDALRQEIERLLSKTAKVDKDNIEPIERMVFKGLAAEEIAREMDGLDIMRQIELRNKGISVDVLDTLIRKYTFLRSDLETRFRAYHANQEDKRLDEDLDLLTGVDFERYLVNLLKEHGFDDVHTTIATGDQGADLIARLNGRTIVIQAKRCRGSVGNRAVQEVVGAVRYYRADEAWVITSGNFTASAKALAQANDVKLIDGYALRNRQFPLNS